MILTNVETVPGKKIVEHYGLVQGSTIRAKHVGRDIMAGLKNMIGGEISEYTKMLAESREQSVDRMIAGQFACNFIHLHSTSMCMLDAFLEIEELVVAPESDESEG